MIMRRLVVFLITILFFSLIQAKELAVLSELINPDAMDIEDNNLYVLEGSKVFVYSLADFQLLREFGKTGNGPGELSTNSQLRAQMQLLDGEVFLNTPFKWVKFSADGRFIGEKRLPFIAFQIFPFGKNYAATKYTGSNDGVNKQGVILFDKDLNEVKKLYEQEFLDFRKTGKVEILPNIILMKRSANRLYMFDQARGFYIEVFDVKGEKLKTIQLDYKKIKLTGDFKEKVMAWLETQPGYKSVPEDIVKMIYLPDYLPIMKDFRIIGSRVYVHTYRKENDRVEFVVLDLEGKLLKKVMLPGAEKNVIQPAPYTMVDDRFYYLKENFDEEQWELHTAPLN
jgi:hypothetical protein